MIFEVRDMLEKIGDETGLGPGIDIVDLRDRFHPTIAFRYPWPTCWDSWAIALP